MCLQLICGQRWPTFPQSAQKLHCALKELLGTVEYSDVKDDQIVLLGR